MGRATGRGCYNDAYITQFIQPDTMIPAGQGVIGFDRYAYSNNTPIVFSDPSGHFINLALALGGAVVGAAIGTIVAAAPQMIKNIQAGQPLTTNIDPVEVAKSAAVGAVSGAVGGLTCCIATAAMRAGGLGAAINSGIVSGVASGQAARATENVLNGQAIKSGLGNPAGMVQDALLGGVTAAAG